MKFGRWRRHNKMEIIHDGRQGGKGFKEGGKVGEKRITESWEE